MDTGRIIAVGDIHGCSTALATLIEAINPTSADTLVFLGDFIDRGPDSRGVLERIIGLGEVCSVVSIQGNHEEMLLAAQHGQANLQFWLSCGGAACLASYGQALSHPAMLPGEHIDFLRNCRDYYETVGHFFVHAYYDPHVPLHEQNWGGLRWTSPPPKPVPHRSGKIAVVGHTAQKNGAVLDLGCVKVIDTFCHGGGWLTALDVTTDRLWQANQHGLLR